MIETLGAALERLKLHLQQDPALKTALGRRFLLEQAVPARPGEVDEIDILDGGVVQEALVRDHNAIVYRLERNRAVIDPELTAALQRQRRAASGEPPEAAPLQGLYGPIVIENPLSFAAGLGRLTGNVAELRAQNEAILQALRSAAGGVAAATAAALGEQIKQPLMQAVAAASRSAELLDELDRTTAALISLLEGARRLHPLGIASPLGGNPARH